MLGYLNHPSPLDADGFDTGDAVEVDGEWIRILGRQSDLINVGGLARRLYPAEVESVLPQMPGVAMAGVFGEPSAIMGSVVAAYVDPEQDHVGTNLRSRCASSAAPASMPYKVFVRVDFGHDPQYTERFKKNRAPVA